MANSGPQRRSQQTTRNEWQRSDTKYPHFPYAPFRCVIKQANRADDRKQKQAETSSTNRRKKEKGNLGYSRLEFIPNMERLSWLYLRPGTSPEVNFRSRFLNPFLATDENGIK